VTAPSAPNPTQNDIIELVASIQPFDALEAAHIDQTLRWLHSGLPIFRTAKPATPPTHLVAYFVLFDIDARQLLLVDHKNAKLWLPSGGHVEPDEHPYQTVIRELKEELKLQAFFFQPQPLFITITQTQGIDRGHTDVSLWYLLLGDIHHPLTYDTEEFFRVAWFAVDDIPVQRVEPHLARFVAKLNGLLAEN
jgi:8-oxo-dGTP pyrophosphatase MutT (NUDIX family)